MKLKYYLRGLGIGMLVTALIMGFTTRDSRPLTDAEIKAAAAELGMVESDSLRLADLPQNQTPEPTKQSETTPEPTKNPESTPEATKEPETTPEPGSEETPELTEEPEAANADDPEMTPEPATEEAEKSGAVVSVTVDAGVDSRTVCNLLEEAGAITDAVEFDKYLCDHGYSKRICVGTFEIPADASWEEITKIITKSK